VLVGERGAEVHLEQELDDVFRPNALEPEEPVHVN